jgi:hypothetical protein
MALLPLAVGILGGPRAVADGPVLPLRVLYVGDNKTRAGDYAGLLKMHFAQVRLAERTGFDPAATQEADVVLLAWSQSESDLRKAQSPLGKLENWSRPTVLLGSAGLLMAGQWQIIGGAG